MTLIDTSAWVEFLRDTGSPVCDRVDALLEGEVAVCEPVVMRLPRSRDGRDRRHEEASEGKRRRDDVDASWAAQDQPRSPVSVVMCSQSTGGTGGLARRW
jgi:predicted nucleic acid-binding protein